MEFINRIKEKARKNIKTIVLPESNDIRTLKAASIVKSDGFAEVVLIGKEKEILELAVENEIPLEGIRIIDPETFEDTNLLVERFYELRKHKGVTLEVAKKMIMENHLYFGNMLVRLDYVDGLVAGAVNSSANVLRASLQILKTAEDAKLVSSFFLMEIPDCEYGNHGVFVFSDCGIIQNPTSEELVEIANSSAKTFQQLVGEEPIIAMLSHSTLGSSNHRDVDKVHQAVKLAKETYPELTLDGELQFDAAIVPEVAKIKAPNSLVAGRANVLIFPDLDAGNIAYKVAERLAKANAYGPITQGIRKPVNDLSRGCDHNDIVGVIAITSVQCK